MRDETVSVFQRKAQEKRQQDLNFVLISKQGNSVFFSVAESGCKFQANLKSQELNRNIQCEYLAPKESTGEAQAAILRQVLSRDPPVDGISIAVVDHQVVTPILQQALRQGIPVITYDSDSFPEGRLTYIGTDNREMGRSLAKVLQQLRPQGGTYGLISDAAPNLQERENGFREYMNEFNWFETPTSPQFTIDRVDVSLDITENFLTQPEPVDALIPLGGWPMLDTNQTRWKNLVDNHRNVTFCVGDTLPGQIDLLMEGYADALIGQVPFQMGTESVNVLYNHAVGAPVEQIVTLTYLLEIIRKPLVLPTLHVDQNHVGSLRYIGLFLFATVAITAMSCIAWTWNKRRVRVVMTSQPVFLIMIAVGTLILGATMVPLSFDDSDIDYTYGQGDTVCMSIPWLACIGFAITFSALFSKTWRINRVFHGATGNFSRVTVKPIDVMVPFGLLVGSNILVLLCWTLFNPLEYVRAPHDGTDVWNRVISSYGACRSETPPTFYLTALGILNVGITAIANWQAYEARSIQSEFAESHYIAIVMGSLLQGALTGIPILFIVRENPPAFYLILIFMIFITCMASLLLIFVPKILTEREFTAQPHKVQMERLRTAVSASLQPRGDKSTHTNNCVSGDGGGESASFFHEDALNAVSETLAITKEKCTPEQLDSKANVSFVSEQGSARHSTRERDLKEDEGMDDMTRRSSSNILDDILEEDS